MKKPDPVTYLSAKKIFNQLKIWKEINGWPPEDVLNQSILNGWKRIFELKEKKDGFNKNTGQKSTKNDHLGTTSNLDSTGIQPEGGSGEKMYKGQINIFT